LVHKQKVIDAHVDPPNLTFFREAIFRLLGGAAPSYFYTPDNPVHCTSNLIWGAGWPQVALCPIFLVIIIMH